MARPSRSLPSRVRSLRGGRLAVVVVFLLAALLGVARAGAWLEVNVLWFRSVGYEDVFWRRLAWSWGTRGLVATAIAAFVFVNLRLVVGTLGAIQIKRRFGDLEIAEQLPRSYTLWSAAGVAGLFGLWFGALVLESNGIQALLASVAPAWGVRDPIFARDLSFYLFVLPVLRTALVFATFVTFLVGTVCLGGYALTGALRWGRGAMAMGDVPRIHLGCLVTLLLCLIAARFWIDRYLQLMSGSSGVQGIFGFTDAEARLPALKLMSAVALVGAAAVFWGAWRDHGAPAVAGVVTVVAGWILGVQFYPSLVQRFRVEPNELGREAPYIEMNMRFTRLGFGLDDLKRSVLEPPAPTADWGAISRQMGGLPYWSADPLLTAFQQLEARFRYYDFPGVTIDRYAAADGPGLVALSVREVDPTAIEERSWQNLHLRERYVSGVGAVASDAADRTEDGKPIMFLSGIPPEFEAAAGAPAALALRRSAVFFGSRAQSYAIVNAGPAAFLAPDSTPGVPGVDFPVGIPLSSRLRTLAFAWDLGEPNLLFASEVNAASRIVIHRQVTERAQAIFPYLRYPEAPHPVVLDGRLVWLLDGFTATRFFPLAHRYDLDPGRPATYARNSVRVVVDAVGGDVAFYRMPGADPLLEAYDRAFPGLFRPFDDLPVGLRDHLRYSRKLLDVQSQVLLQYHQETPQQFHAQQDVWAVPTELMQGTSPVPYRPEYGLWTLPGESSASFLLATTFVPAARQNLTAILAGRVNSDGGPELFLIDVPTERQAPGPRQVEAMVEQDPTIAAQFSLWRQSGSRVWTGHLHVIPEGGRIVYVESVFLASEDDAIPELRRFAVSDGESVSMQPTLAETLREFGGTARPTRTPAPDSPAPPAGAGTQWPNQALELLKSAQSRLKEGDWAGFGTTLKALQDLLERIGDAPGAKR